MNSNVHLKELFWEVMELPVEAQMPYLEVHCADENLRQEVLDLVAMATISEKALLDLKENFRESIPEIPNFEVESRIGFGGMGIVYKANQVQPVQRVVAIKVLHSTYQHAGDRFLREIQSLGSLAHPHIAKVFEGGKTTDGQPFFSMEYVEGEDFIDFCKSKSLSLEARVSLVIQMCKAMSHAHQKGIIHCDLKPSNVLVQDMDGAYSPKIIDFGIAKQLANGAHEFVALTHTLCVLGTPQYMSPEQMDGDRLLIDTRTDVYAIGAMLYEAVVGVPFLPNPDKIRLSRDKHPSLDLQRPSKQIGQSLDKNWVELAKERGLKTKSWKKRVANDLDWVMMKALAFEQDDRYPSVLEFAEDLQAWLDGRPITALKYNILQFSLMTLKRNKLLAAFMMSLFLGSIASSLGWIQAFQESQNVQRELDRGNALNQMLVRLLTSPKPFEDGRDVRVLDVIDDFENQLNSKPEVNPELELSVRQVLADSRMSLQDYEKARSNYESILSISNDINGHQPPFKVFLDLAHAMSECGQTKEALAFIEKHKPTVPEDHLADFGLTRISLLLKLRHMEPVFAELRQFEEKFSKLSDEQMIQFLGLKTSALNHDSQFQEAEQLALRWIQEIKNTQGNDALEMIEALAQLKLIYINLQKFDLALEQSQKVYDIHVELYGPEKLSTLTQLSYVGYSHLRLGDFEAAEKALEESTEKARKLVKEKRLSGAVDIMNKLGALYAMSGRFEKLLELTEEVMTHRKALLGPDHPFYWVDLYNYNETLMVLGKRQEAMETLQEELELRMKHQGDSHKNTLYTRSCLAIVLLEKQESAKDLVELKSTANQLEEMVPSGSYEGLRSRLNYIEGLFILGQKTKVLTELVPFLEEAGNLAESIDQNAADLVSRIKKEYQVP